MATEIGEMVVKVTADSSDLQKDLKAAEANVKKAGKTLSKVGDQMVNVGKKLTAAVTLPIVAIGVAMVKAASDAEESAAKFETVFSDITDAANATATEIADSFGLSTQKAQELLGGVGDLLTGFGFTQESALDLADQVTRLGVDLASFTNFAGGASGAVDALTKGLFGEREALKSLGIAIREEDVVAETERLIASGRLAADVSFQQARAYATLQISLRQSKNAVGDFARTQDSFANQMRILKSDVSDLAVSFGKELLPFAKDLIAAARELVARFQGLDQEQKQQIIRWAGIAAAAGPASIALGQLLKVIQVLASNKLALALAGTAAAVGGIVAGIKAIDAAQTKRALQGFSDELKRAALDGEDLNEVVQRIAEETGLTTGQVASLADEWKFLNDAQREALDGIIEASEEADKSIKATIKDNRKAQEQIDRFLLAVQHGTYDVETAVRSTAKTYDVTIDSVIAMAEASDKLVGSAIEELAVLKQQRAEQEARAQFQQAMTVALQAEKEAAEEIAVVEAKGVQLTEDQLENIKVRKEATAELQAELAKLQAFRREGLIDEQEFLEDTIGAYDEYAKTLTEATFSTERLNEVGGQQLQNAKDTLVTLRDELAVLQSQEEREAALAVQHESAALAYRLMLDDMAEIGSATEKVKEDTRELAEIWADEVVPAVQHFQEEVWNGVMAIGQAITGLGSALDSVTQANIANIEARREAETEEATSRITDADALAAELTRIDEEAEERVKQLELEGAKRRKKFAIFDALLNGANAVINALTMKPVWLAPLAIALAGATTAAQLAAIKATPLPALASGGIATQDTVARIGEGGPEAILPLSEQVLGAVGAGIARATASPVGGGGLGQNVTVMIELDRKTLYSGIHRASEDGMVKIAARAVV